MSEEIDKINAKLEALALRMDQNDRAHEYLIDSLHLIVKESKVVTQENRSSLNDAIDLIRRLLLKVDTAVADGDVKYKEYKAIMDKEEADKNRMSTKLRNTALVFVPFSVAILIILNIISILQ
jgi:hypothetical protein